MSDRARGKNHPQDPRQPPRPGSGRGRLAKGYDAFRQTWKKSPRVIRETDLVVGEERPGAAARAAAEKQLRPTVRQLQKSALGLLDKMIAVGKTKKAKVA